MFSLGHYHTSTDETVRDRNHITIHTGNRFTYISNINYYFRVKFGAKAYIPGQQDSLGLVSVEAHETSIASILV
jgi:hypothetical protein